MKKNKKMLIICCICAVLIGVFTINFVKVNADSGFDSSWDSGGFDFGGSDWGGSSWDSDWGYSGGGGSSYHGSSDPTFVVMYILLMIIIFIIWNSRHKGEFGNYYSIIAENPAAISDIKKAIPDFDKVKFCEDTYQKFIKIQEAWMNFDYNELRKYLTDELYNTYKSQLKTLELKKQRNIMSNFEVNKNVITSFYESKKEYTIKTNLRVTFFDYLIDDNKNKVLRGTRKKRLVMTYELTFVKSKSERPNKCPNCGSTLSSESTSNVCPYCKSSIVSDTHGWILSKKEAKSQRMED